MVRKLRHMIFAFLAGILSHKFLLLAYQTWTSRPMAPGGEVLFLPLMALLVSLGWQARGAAEWTKKETHR